MKLTDLVESYKDANVETCQKRVFGIEVDSADNVTPPAGLEEVGFLVSFTEDGDIAESVLDLAISYKISNLDVLLEIPYSELEKSSFNKVDLSYLLTVSSNIGTWLSFLPPQTSEQAAWDKYTQVICSISDKYFEKQNFDQMVLPFTNYLQYLFMEIILGKDKMANFAPTDEYIQNYYGSADVEKSNAMKDVLRQHVYTIFEGQENFELNAKHHLTVAYEQVEKFAPVLRESAIKKISYFDDLDRKAEAVNNTPEISSSGSTLQPDKPELDKKD